MSLTAETLRSRVRYDAETGTFTWLLHPGNANGHRAWDKQWAGKPVSRRFVKDPWNPKRTNVLLRILGRAYGEHRLAWLYVHGRWPAQEIDHRDGDPTNNRIANLREATHAQNQMNKGPMRNNKLGVKGVTYWPRHKRYVAQIRIPGTKKVKHIGMFKTLDEAKEAYRKYAVALHGEFAHASITASRDAVSP